MEKHPKRTYVDLLEDEPLSSAATDPTYNHLRTMATTVMDTLGLGFSEAVYQAALEAEMRLNHVHYVHEPTIPIFYKSFQVGCLKPDLLVNHSFIVELKAMGPSHKNGREQLRRYLTAAHAIPNNTTKYTGVLINFCQNPVTFQILLAPEITLQDK